MNAHLLPSPQSRSRLTAVAVLAVYLCALAAPAGMSLCAPAGKAPESLVFSGDDAFPPYEFVGADGTPAGYHVDVIRAIGRIMGLEVRVRLDRWDKVKADLQAGAVDVLAMSYSQERDTSFDFSTPHSILNSAAFIREGGPRIASPDDLAGKKIIVQNQDLMHEWAVAQGLSANLLLADSHPQALRMLASGEGDCALLAKVHATHLAHKMNLKNVRPSGPDLHSRRYCFAVKEGNAELLAVLNEGLSILKATGEYAEIYDKWLGVLEPRGVDAGRIVKYIAVVLLPVLSLLILALLWSWTLRRRVAARTRELRAETERLARASSAGGVALWEWDIQSGSLEWSDAVDSMLGYEAGAFPRTLQAWEEVIHPDDRSRVMHMLKRHLEAGTPYDAEYRAITRDGGHVWWRDVGSCRRDGAGQACQMFGACTDITVRKQAEASLQKMNRAFRMLTNCNQALIRLTDESALLGEICRIIVEDGGYRLAWVGFAENDPEKTIRPVAQRGYEDGYLDGVAISWGDTERGRGPTGTAIRTGTHRIVGNILSDQSFLPWKDEAAKRGSLSMIALPLTADGKTLGALDIHAAEADAFENDEVRLLTELADDLAYGITTLRTRVALGQSEERFRLVTETIGDVFWMSDLAIGRMIYISPAYERLWGRTRDSLYESPRSFLDAVHPADHEGLLALYEDRHAHGKEYECEYRIQATDGSLRWIRERGFPIRDEQGRAYLMTGVSSDITERKHAIDALAKARDELERQVAERTESLRVAKEEAEAANLAKSTFVASMSHELRTPLNAIIGFSQVLQEKHFGALNEKQEEYVTDILDSGRHLLSLINDILDLSKIEAGKLELELKGVMLAEMLEGSLVAIRERCRRRGITLDLRAGDGLRELEVTADERRLRQIMFNLLSNAAKFTAEGGTITVEARMEGDEVMVSVADTGIGINREDQTRIFEPFTQVTEGKRHRPAGTGLGLSITRRLVERHGGRMAVESEGEGKGSRFTFWLPVKPVPAGVDNWISGHPDLVDTLGKVISLSRRHGREFALCCFWSEGDDLGRHLPAVRQSVRGAKRDYDVLAMDRDGRSCLVLLESKRAAATAAAARLKAELESQLGLAIRYATAVFPEDGQTAEDLIRRISKPG